MDLGNLPINPPTPCLYCPTYASIQSDYPVNAASFDTESEVPRCEMHSQYTCFHCEQSVHFNGIAYCDECQQFTCLRCGVHAVEREEFFVYNYYYTISCRQCGLELESLEYAEIEGHHPFQIGEIRPKEQIQVWLPLTEDIGYQPDKKQWGVQRLVNMAKSVEFQPVAEDHGDSKEVWDANAEIWKEMTRSGDVNHLEIIIPQMLHYLDPQAKQGKTMDIACGEGTFTRKVAEAGYTVVGTDISNLVDYAIETEEQEKLGIEYQKVGVHELQKYYEANSFEQVTLNMAIMDIDNLPNILDNVAHILKEGGNFVFSLTHPITAWPVVRTIKLPEDSEKNIDKGWMIDNYGKEQAMKIHMPGLPSPMLYYPRKISTYVNELVRHGFVITGMEEPVPDEELVAKYPRDMMDDYDRNPPFMIMRTRYLGK